MDIFIKNYIRSSNAHFTPYILQEEIVGFIEYLHVDTTVEILYLYVSLNHRRKGIASYLLNTLPKAEVYLLEVSQKNSQAYALYTSYGFHYISTRKKYYANQSDAHVLIKYFE